VAATRTLTPAQFEDDLNRTDFFTGIGEDPGSPSQIEQCFEHKLAGFTYAPKGPDTFTISVNDIDLTECYPPTGDWSVESVIFSVYIDALKVKDDNGNLVDLEGMQYYDVPAFLPLQYNFRAYSFTTYRHIITNETMEYNYIAALHDTSGLSVPCSFDGILDGCQQEDVFHFTSSDPAIGDHIDRTVIDTHNLEVVDRAPYYQNGTMTFTFNDWTGTMTYGNDAYIPPTYTATNGVDTVSGTYTPPLAPALFRTFSGVPIIPFQRAD